MRRLLAATIFCVLAVSAHARGVVSVFDGYASIYGGETRGKDYCNSPLAVGGLMNCDHLTAAHRSLPFGTLVRVTREDSTRHVVVCINDRGPFIEGRVIDVTPEGARVLGFSAQGAGVVKVHLEVVGHIDAHCRGYLPKGPHAWGM